MVKLCVCSLSLIHNRPSDPSLVSQDPANYKDAPTEGIRRVLEVVTGESIPRGEKLDINKIGELSGLTHRTHPKKLARLHSFVYYCRHQRTPGAEGPQACSSHHQRFQGSFTNWKPVSSKNI